MKISIIPTSGRNNFKPALYRKLLGASPLEHIDHAISIKNKGTNHPVNLWPLDATKNLSKGSKSWLTPVFKNAANMSKCSLLWGFIEAGLCRAEGLSIQHSLKRGASASLLAFIGSFALFSAKAWLPTALLSGTITSVCIPLGIASLGYRLFKIRNQRKGI